MFVMLLAALLSCPSADGDTGENTWPQWRGPTGDSVATCTLPTHWSKTENVAWKTALPGWGNSTPAIWQDAIFVTTQDEERLLLLRLDAATGKIVWQREVGQGRRAATGPLGNGRFHDEHNMASPSPVTDGKHVWAHFGNGDLACYDFAGKRSLVAQPGRALRPLHDLVGPRQLAGPGRRPAHLRLHAGPQGRRQELRRRPRQADRQGALVRRARHRRQGGAGRLLHDAGPLTATTAVPKLIVFGGNVLDAYDPATGKQLWQCDAFKGNRVISGPTLAGDTVYAIQGMNGPALRRAGRRQRRRDRHPRALEVRRRHARRGQPAGDERPGVPGDEPRRGDLPGRGHGQGTVEGAPRPGLCASPLAAGGKVYFFSKEGKATIVEASATFKVVGRADLGEETIASPAAAGGELFIRTKEHLYRIGKE